MDFIPTDDLSFNAWERNFMPKLLLKYATWEIPQEAVDALSTYQNTYHNAWAEGGIGAKKTRTSIQVEAKDEAQDAYINNDVPEPLGLRAFIKAYIAYNPLVSNTERNELGVPVHKKTKTKHKVATKSSVIVNYKSLGPYIIETECRSTGLDNENQYTNSSTGNTKTSRPKKEPGYEIRLSHKIISKGEAEPTNPEGEDMTMVIITQARFTRNFGAENQTKILCEYAQWYNPKHPELAGPWNPLQKVVIT